MLKFIHVPKKITRCLYKTKDDFELSKFTTVINWRCHKVYSSILYDFIQVLKLLEGMEEINQPG